MKKFIVVLTASLLYRSFVMGQNSLQFKPIAVIELFTSEGCSSCPPADKVVANLLEEAPSNPAENIFVLSYHVDYWNRLGWKDSFSRSEYSARQAQYVSQLNLESAYTPQVIVNGQYVLVGNDNVKLSEAIEKARQIKSEAGFTKLSAYMHSGEITVDYQLAGVFDKSQINFALIGLKESTAVKAGENRGRRLNHVNVVRQLIQTAAAESGKVVFKNLPSDAPGNLAVIAYVQRSDLKIIGAGEVKLAN
jgi:hypothetical protein